MKTCLIFSFMSNMLSEYLQYQDHPQLLCPTHINKFNMMLELEEKRELTSIRIYNLESGVFRNSHLHATRKNI